MDELLKTLAAAKGDDELDKAYDVSFTVLVTPLTTPEETDHDV